MPKQKEHIDRCADILRIRHEKTRWSNLLISAPIGNTLLERRILYFLTLLIKRKFTERGLGVPENWKELYFYLNEADLAQIGGIKNINYTYSVLCEIGKKFFPFHYYDKLGNKILGRMHWIDYFEFDKESRLYKMRVSPEIMPYIIDVNESFTTFDVGVALALKSKYTQKMYEFCCQHSGDFQYVDKESSSLDYNYKKRVIPLKMSDFRRMFNLDEKRDQKTGKVQSKASYNCFTDIRRNILEVAQKELYELYNFGACDVWFDFQQGDRKGLGGKVDQVFIYVYTKEHPKEGQEDPWKKGDKPLSPYAISHEEVKKLSPKQKLQSNSFYDIDDDMKCQLVKRLLEKYFDNEDLTYYMNAFKREAKLCRDTWIQVIQVIQEKESQPKFRDANRNYQRKNLKEFVFKVNLLDFGWSVAPPPMQKQYKRNRQLKLRFK